MNRLQHVLSPKSGGTITLLRSAEKADVVFCAHSGLEKVMKISNLLNGGIVGISLRVHFWRVSRTDIPKETEAQEKWLLEQWEKMDRIVGELKSSK
jgi:hypothetical protein